MRWIACDGVVRRFEEPRELAEDGWIEKYDRTIQVGYNYRAEVVWDGDSLQLVNPLDPPHHHFIGAHFENIESFPELRNPDRSRTIVFGEVLSQEIMMRTEWQWTSLYELRVVEVLPTDAAAG